MPRQKKKECKKSILIHEESIDILFQLSILNPDMIWNRLSSDQNEKNLLILLLITHSNVFSTSMNKPDILSLFDSEQYILGLKKTHLQELQLYLALYQKRLFHQVKSLLE